VLTPLANARFDSETARRRLESFYGVRALDGFGSFGRAEIAAAGALVDYVTLTQQGTQPGATPYLAPPQRVAPGSLMQIDAATRSARHQGCARPWPIPGWCHCRSGW